MGLRNTFSYTRSFLHQRNRLALVVRYTLPFIFTAMALKLTLMLPNVPVHSFFTFFVAACAASAYSGGASAGVLCIFLSAAAADYFTVVPVGSFGFGNRGDTIRFAGFVATALFICWLIARLQSTSKALRRERNALHLSKRRIEYVERHAKVWNWEYDLTTRRVSWSNPYGNVVSRHEQSYEQWLQMVHQEDRECVREAIDDALTKGEFEAQFRIMLGDSQPRWVMGRAHLLLMDGKPLALVGINMDLFLRSEPRGSSPSPGEPLHLGTPKPGVLATFTRFD